MNRWLITKLQRLELYLRLKAEEIEKHNARLKEEADEARRSKPYLRQMF